METPASSSSPTTPAKAGAQIQPPRWGLVLPWPAVRPGPRPSPGQSEVGLDRIAAPKGVRQGFLVTNKLERDGVDAIALARGRRSVGEDVALVAVAAGAAGLDADHAVAGIAHA